MAWEGVLLLIPKLSEKFPNIEFQYAYADEYLGSKVGRGNIRNGETDMTFPDDESNEAFEIVFFVKPGLDEYLELTDEGYRWKAQTSPDRQSPTWIQDISQPIYPGFLLSESPFIFIPFRFLFTISRLLNQPFLTVSTHPLAGLLIIFEAAFTETAKHALQELADNPEYQQYNYNIFHEFYFYSFNNNKNTNNSPKTNIQS